MITGNLMQNKQIGEMMPPFDLNLDDDGPVTYHQRCAAITGMAPSRTAPPGVQRLAGRGTAAQHLRKGSQIYVEDQIRRRKFNDKDGVEKHATGIRLDQM